MEESYETITINESCDLPITKGTIKIDSSLSPITIFMKNSDKIGDILEITKISHDSNIISLYSDSCLVNDADITIFGSTIDDDMGTAKTLILKSCESGWIIQDQR